VTIYFDNLGYSKKAKSYQTSFEFGRFGLITCFKSDFAEQFICPAPDLRFAHDMERLEDSVKSALGRSIVEIDI
jgi:hypothetical protein